MSVHLYHRPKAEPLSLADLTIEDQINIGDGTDTHTIKAVQETGLGGRLTFGLDETARTAVLCDVGDIDTDLGLAARTHPTLYIYSNVTTNKTRLDYAEFDFSGGSTVMTFNFAKSATFKAYTDDDAGHSFEFSTASTNGLTDADAEQAFFYLAPEITQTSTAGYIGLLMDVTETSTGSGTNALMDLRVATASKFKVANDGEVFTTSTYGTMQTATGDGTTTIDWGLGNYMYFTFGAQNDTFTFTAPANKGRIILVLKQDGTGSRLATWPGTVLWPGNVVPTLSTGANEVDIVSLFYDGTNYFGVANYDFS